MGEAVPAGRVRLQTKPLTFQPIALSVPLGNRPMIYTAVAAYVPNLPVL